MTYRHHRLGPDVAHRMVIVGDLGQSSVSQDTLRQVMALQPDSVQLNGDLAYANGHDLKWDSWQRLIQPLASAVPLMVAAGNHDISCSFPPRVGGVGWCNERTMDAYITRFTMPEAPAPVGPQPGAAEGIGCARHFACCLPSKQTLTGGLLCTGATCSSATTRGRRTSSCFAPTCRGTWPVRSTAGRLQTWRLSTEASALG